ncbi:hypothetical protein BDW22DRAFT_1309921, partial [Trametopsis cervina]
KKEQQWENWTKNVIPSLIPIYLDLICRSKSLRTLDNVRVLTSLPCECRKKTLRVALVSFDKLESAEIASCSCTSAAAHLMQRGFFPSAPTAPTLAVDLKLLEFIRVLFVRMPPNVTSFADAVESFLQGRQYKLRT